MIQDSQTNTIFVSPILKEYGNAYDHIEKAIARESGLYFRTIEGTKDIWCRDYMPIQISIDKMVGYKYYPNYLKKSKYLRGFITDNSQYPSTIRLDLILDGGNVVKCHDSVIMTEKVFLENPDKSKKQVLDMLEEAFEAEIILLPWDEDEEYGHSDGIVHYVSDNTLLMTNYRDFSKEFASKFLKILESKFNVVELHYSHKSPLNWAYINFVRVGDLILLPQLDIPEDDEAMDQISAVFPECRISPIPCRDVVLSHGALNCVTWNIAL